MGYFFDDFNGEVEGTSPPANWAPSATYPPVNFEVDDVHCYSSPHAAWLKAPQDALGKGMYTSDSVFTIEPVIIRLYLLNDELFYVQTFDDTPLSAIDILGSADHHVYRWDGDGWVDTGQIWATGTMYKVKIVHDFVNDLFDMWWDDIQIVTDGVLSHELDNFERISIIAGEKQELWFDNVQIGNMGSVPSIAGSLCGVNV